MKFHLFYRQVTNTESSFRMANSETIDKYDETAVRKVKLSVGFNELSTTP